MLRARSNAWVISGVCSIVLAMPSTGVCAIAAAQTASSPDQELLRQRERERALRQQFEPRTDQRLPAQTPPAPQRIPADETPCFPITQIKLEGDDAARFQWLLRAADQADDPAIGRCLGTTGIQIVMARLQRALIERGYVTTRVLTGPQDLKTGVLRLTVMAGTIGQIRRSEGTSAAATLWNALPLHPGDILNARAVEQGMENFQRVPSVDANVQIIPSAGANARPGQSDLLVHWAQPRRMRWSASLDDSGSRATGRLQAGVTGSIDDALRLNDLFYLNVNHSLSNEQNGNTKGMTAHYSLPLGYWLLSVTGSDYGYRQTLNKDTPNAYQYRGTSRTGEWRVSRVVLRTARSKSGVYLRGWQRHSRNYVNDVEVPIQRWQMSGWEAGLTHRRFLGAATLDASIAVRPGHGSYGIDNASQQEVKSRVHTRLYVADAQWNQPFQWGKQQLHYNAEWRGQWADGYAAPQDRFAIGGRYTVRGFDGENALTGERGWLLRNDLGLDLGSRQTAYIALDTGHVGGVSAHQQIVDGHRLTGAVLGLRGGWNGLYWDVFAGAALQQPRGFVSAYTITGFTLNAAF